MTHTHTHTHTCRTRIHAHTNTHTDTHQLRAHNNASRHSFQSLRLRCVCVCDCVPQSPAISLSPLSLCLYLSHSHATHSPSLSLSPFISLCFWLRPISTHCLNLSYPLSLPVSVCQCLSISNSLSYQPQIARRYVYSFSRSPSILLISHIGAYRDSYIWHLTDSHASLRVESCRLSFSQWNKT